MYVVMNMFCITMVICNQKVVRAWCVERHFRCLSQYKVLRVFRVLGRSEVTLGVLFDLYLYELGM